MRHTLLAFALLAAPVFAADPLPLAIAKLDRAAFTALNHCDEENQLDLYKDYLDKSIEVFHGTAGVTSDRSDVLDDAVENRCGKRRPGA